MQYLEPYQIYFNLADTKQSNIESIGYSVINLLNLTGLYLFYYIFMETAKKVAHFEINKSNITSKMYLLYPYLEDDEDLNPTNSIF
jgi:hypothetical protein